MKIATANKFDINSDFLLKKPIKMIRAEKQQEQNKSLKVLRVAVKESKAKCRESQQIVDYYDNLVKISERKMERAQAKIDFLTSLKESSASLLGGSNNNDDVVDDNDGAMVVATTNNKESNVVASRTSSDSDISTNEPLVKGEDELVQGGGRGGGVLGWLKRAVSAIMSFFNNKFKKKKKKELSLLPSSRAQRQTEEESAPTTPDTTVMTAAESSLSSSSCTTLVALTNTTTTTTSHPHTNTSISVAAVAARPAGDNHHHNHAAGTSQALSSSSSSILLPAIEDTPPGATTTNDGETITKKISSTSRLSLKMKKIQLLEQQQQQKEGDATCTTTGCTTAIIPAAGRHLQQRLAKNDTVAPTAAATSTTTTTTTTKIIDAKAVLEEMVATYPNESIDKQVQRRGLQTLSLLLSSHPWKRESAYGMIATAATTTFDTGAFLFAVVSSMDEYKSDAEIQTLGCSVLSLLAKSRTTTYDEGANRMIQVLFRIIKEDIATTTCSSSNTSTIVSKENHQDHHQNNNNNNNVRARLKLAAFEAIKEWTQHYTSIHPPLIRSGLVPILIEHLPKEKMFGEDGYIALQETICRIFFDLAQNPNCPENVYVKGFGLAAMTRNMLNNIDSNSIGIHDVGIQYMLKCCSRDDFDTFTSQAGLFKQVLTSVLKAYQVLVINKKTAVLAAPPGTAQTVGGLDTSVIQSKPCQVWLVLNKIVETSCGPASPSSEEAWNPKYTPSSAWTRELVCNAARGAISALVAMPDQDDTSTDARSDPFLLLLICRFLERTRYASEMVVEDDPAYEEKQGGGSSFDRPLYFGKVFKECNGVSVILDRVIRPYQEDCRLQQNAWIIVQWSVLQTKYRHSTCSVIVQQGGVQLLLNILNRHKGKSQHLTLAGFGILWCLNDCGLLCDEEAAAAIASSGSLSSQPSSPVDVVSCVVENLQCYMVQAAKQQKEQMNKEVLYRGCNLLALLCSETKNEHQRQEVLSTILYCDGYLSCILVAMKKAPKAQGRALKILNKLYLLYGNDFYQAIIEATTTKEEGAAGLMGIVATIRSDLEYAPGWMGCNLLRNLLHLYPLTYWEKLLPANVVEDFAHAAIDNTLQFMVATGTKDRQTHLECCHLLNELMCWNDDTASSSVYGDNRYYCLKLEGLDIVLDVMWDWFPYRKDPLVDRIVGKTCGLLLNHEPQPPNCRRHEKKNKN